MRMKVSLLIPFYGNRYYQLKRGLPFLLNQTYKEYEIVFIDDGLMREGELCPEELLDHPNVKYLQLREGITDIRSPNIAYRHGFYNCDGEFIIVLHPELLIPFDAVETMINEANIKRRNCAIQYHLTHEQVDYLFSNLHTNWKNHFNKIKDIPDFMATVTPWSYTNYHSKGYRNHFSFSGSTRERFEQYMIPETGEWMQEDVFVHALELERGEPCEPIDIEVYHQEHDRVYGTIIQTSERIRRIRESKLR